LKNRRWSHVFLNTQAQFLNGGWFSVKAPMVQKPQTSRAEVSDRILQQIDNLKLLQ
jgi:hypothetical protein